MTEEAPEKQPAVQWSEPDYVLSVYVKALSRRVEPIKEGLWVTLTVQGILVCGEVIPGWQWFEEVSEHSGGEDSLHYTWVADLKEHAAAGIQAHEAFAAGAELTAEQKEVLDTPAGYIHLRNARFFLPSPVPQRGSFWRGRLSEVSGWMPGMMRED